MFRALAALSVLLVGCNAGLHPYDTCVDDGAPSDAGFPALAAELLVPDVDTGVTFYRDTLGFTLLRNTAAQKSCFAELELEGGRVMLSHVPRPTGPDDGIELRFVVRDVDAMDARCRERGVPYVRALADQEYGLRDFVVRDPYGFRVRFGTPR
ncbi:MAG: VOC family protein [Archangium sp.]